MTSNDAQMEVLLRRYAGKSQTSATTEHLDADELNAFAEGAAPEAARTRYLSHLIDCDSCRQVVSQLAITSGKVLAPAAIPTEAQSGAAWWKKLSGFLTPMTLRYAAFAMVLVAVAGVVFMVMRRPRESNLVALNEQARQAPDTVKPLTQAPPQTGGTSEYDANKSKASTSPATLAAPQPTSAFGAKTDEYRSGDNPASSQQPAKEGDATKSPALVGKKAEPEGTEVAPSYAPPPPIDTERSATQQREQAKTAGVAGSGPRKSESTDRLKMMDKSAPAGDMGKDNRSADDLARVAINQAPAPASKRASDEKVKGPRRDMENNSAMNRNSNEVRGRSPQAAASQSVPAEEKAPETRSAGGRKFRRLGNSWVDTKFKSSIPVKNVSRGSSEFNALDSGLRSIAQQLGGEVLVVWKNKAYLIR